MPLLDIAIARPSFQNHWGHTRLQLCVNGKATNCSLLQYEERWASFSIFFQNPGKIKIHLGHHRKLHPKFLVKAVATFDPKISVQSENGGKESNASGSIDESVSSTVHTESSDADSEEIDAKEKSRRMGISRANKGNAPWNKGRKHSPETLQRIRERTKLAMQNPKVRMKLANLGRAQSKEIRDKIGAGVRGGWKRRHQRLEIQATCLFDWQNLIAEAARKGLDEEEELQWNSYEILKEQLQQEWLHRARANLTAPKSLEQRINIAEAITAKWADPEYRERVLSGMAKYHGTPEGVERRAKRKTSVEGRSKRTAKIKVGDAEGSAVNELEARFQQDKFKKGYVPKYKDPLASSEAEMLRSIRIQRVASQTSTNEVFKRAKVVIAEAQKAAKVLEVFAIKSPVAQASLIEARKLIAEATQTIEKIENGDIGSLHAAVSRCHQNHVGKRGSGALTKYLREEYPIGINGIASLQSGQGQNPDFNLYSLKMLDNMDMNFHLPTMFGLYGFGDLENVNSATAQFGPHQTETNRDSDIDSLTHANRQIDSGGAKQEFEDAEAMERLDLRALMDKRHPHLEPNGAAKLNGSSAPNGAKVHIQESPAAKIVTKRWVRGRLVEVVDGE